MRWSSWSRNSAFPFWVALPLAFLVSAALGYVLEKTLYVHVYRKSHLDQVLFTVGLIFMAVAGADYLMGSSQVFASDPAGVAGTAPGIRHRDGALPAADHRHLRRCWRSACNMS